MIQAWEIGTEMFCSSSILVNLCYKHISEFEASVRGVRGLLRNILEPHQFSLFFQVSNLLSQISNLLFQIINLFKLVICNYKLIVSYNRLKCGSSGHMDRGYRSGQLVMQGSRVDPRSSFIFSFVVLCILSFLQTLLQKITSVDNGLFSILKIKQTNFSIIILVTKFQVILMGS